jgi:DNA-binding NtrC family response regulator
MMKANMLLADDDTEVLAALSAAFASEDYDVVIAKTGREAIERMRERRFDIALLDLNMPVKGGWEAFDRLTSIHPLLQVIVITAQPDQYPRAAAAGVAALMEKPLDLPRLLRTIEILLSEPVEQRLSRLAGKHPITRYLRADT